MATPITLSMEGTFINWLKNVGETVKAGDVVAEVESDKATIEIEAPAAGVLSAQNAQPGDSLAEGAVIGQIGESAAEPAPAAPAPVPAAEPAPAPAAPAPAPAAAPAPKRANGAPPAAPMPEVRVKASPLARRIAEEKGIDLRQVAGTGPGGRITKEDVEGFTPPPAPPPTPSPTVVTVPGRRLPEGPDVEIIEISTMRKRIAAGTMESNQTTPTFFVTVECDVAALLALRKQLNDSLPEGATKISVNDMIVKAVALALRQFPNLNSHYYGDKLARHLRVNIGIAVAVPQGGVIYVVAKDADKLSLGALAELNKAMIARARDGKIKPDDISGATFSISNLGPYDVEHFTAIINPPEAGVLAVGSARAVPVVKEGGTLGVGQRMRVTLSVDHRVSDGAEGAEFLQFFRQLVENPMRLLI